MTLNMKTPELAHDMYHSVLNLTGYSQGRSELLPVIIIVHNILHEKFSQIPFEKMRYSPLLLLKM